MGTLTDAYLQWTATGLPKVEASKENPPWSFRVVSFQGQVPRVAPQYSGFMSVIEYSIRQFTHPAESRSINHTLAQHGVLGATPDIPRLGFTFQFLESFRQLHRVCLRLSLSATATALLHIHKVRTQPSINPSINTDETRIKLPPDEHLTKQLRSAYDAYLEILRQVQQRAAIALGQVPEHQTSALLCPPCFYVLRDEPALIPKFLAAMDGNNSLKLIDSSYQTGKTRADDRVLPWPRWLEPDEVDKYKNEVQTRSKKKVRSISSPCILADEKWLEQYVR
jgi:hypothetical protein